MSAPGLITDNGMVRRRTMRDGWPAVLPLTVIRGASHNGGRAIRIALPVTFDTLRGSSGQAVHPGVATALGLGIDPGEQRTFTGKAGDITVFWRLPRQAAAAPDRCAAWPPASAPNSATPSCWPSTSTTALSVRSESPPTNIHPSGCGLCSVGRSSTRTQICPRCRPDDLIALLRSPRRRRLIALIDTVQL